MLGEAFAALIQATLPVGVFSFLLTWWAIKHDYFGKAATLKELERNVKQHTEALKKKKKARKEEKKQAKNKKSKSRAERASEDLLKEAVLDPEAELFETQHSAMNPVHKKWLAFGGGFYGVISLLTYVVIELDEIRDFFVQFHGIVNFFQEISFGMLIRLLVDSILNFIWAITWPIYWLNWVPGNYAWIWLVAAYAGYWMGSRLAFRNSPENAPGED
jgi:hypothetical protein